MFCSKCGTKNDESSNFCIKCGASLQMAGTQSARPAPGNEQERVLLTVPKCQRDKFARGTDFCNLLITDRRIICGKTGSSFFRTKGLAGAAVVKIAKYRQDTEKFSGIDPDEIAKLDRHNFAVPFVGFDEIKVSKQLGQPYIRFKLNKEGRRFDRNSAVPRFLTFDRQYLEPLQLTLKDLAGPIVRT
jgi:hypothetical protein